MPNKKRPLSPHLQVYRLGFQMVLSGLHRIAGMALGLGTLIMVWWAMALASGAEAYAVFEGVMVHPLGRLVLFGFTFSLIYHGLNGIRHLVWDTGRGFEKEAVKASGLLVVALTVLLTVAVWVFAYMQAGKI
ncbi:MAG: succinate dehydrogenase, cytochrome b556 subunit [Proteobacteria bacterium]|nr:succinate dehydrogenase, cytochrome b556 subunit [Pseudomonadota bacterium]MCH8082206.1 succinate dehydrogenase, cytochrome b556 subunit [Pseudomonadota bacterium]MCH8322794.1 succinate dehydrogenase, cytochrome b556 subunit [Pseudomonadota bacterium]